MTIVTRFVFSAATSAAQSTTLNSRETCGSAAANLIMTCAEAPFNFDG